MSATPITRNGAHHPGGLPATAPIERVEGLIQLVILLAVGVMAAAASFTHVHDWTMHNLPAGTGTWFGWANAVISDLVPLGVGLEVRRRRRHGLPIGWYPVTIICAAASLSLAGQLAQAKPSASGWLLAAVPALGFLALTKLILSRPTASATTVASSTPPSDSNEKPSTTVNASTMDNAIAPIASTVNDVGTRQASTEPADPVPAHLLAGARFAVVNHHQTTGRAITADELAARMSLTPAVAGRLLAALDEPTPASANGTPIGTTP